MSLLRSLICSVVFFSGAAKADTLRVVADIAPVHALVAQVMQGAGAPELLVLPGSSPHNYALRPSQARNLQNSELVIWVGEDLSPWLEKPLSTLASQAEIMKLMDAPGTVLRARRGDRGDHSEHDGQEEHHEEEEHEAAHDEDHEDAHDEHNGDEEHENGHDDHHANHHAGGNDPHVWLDPENAAVWLGLIAQKLSDLDPENAALYLENAETAQAEIQSLTHEITTILAPAKEQSFVTFHDAFQYFDVRFDLSFAGALSLGDATEPSPARVSELRSRLAQGDIRCAFREPQFNDRLLVAAAEGTELQIGVVDPLGSMLPQGPDLYADLLRDIAKSFASCGAK